MDFQKMGEIIFANTKYSVLRPTVHVTKELFEVPIQKRNNRNFPEKKMFVDRNGFRHYWSGFEGSRQKNFRKAVSETNVKTIDSIENSTGKSVKILNEANDNNTLKPDRRIDKVTKAKFIKRQPLRKRKTIERTNEIKEQSAAAKSVKNEPPKEGKGKTKVMTSFFCPFFGVMTMVSYID